MERNHAPVHFAIAYSISAIRLKTNAHTIGNGARGRQHNRISALYKFS